jgi:hypothetical protein
MSDGLTGAGALANVEDAITTWMQGFNAPKAIVRT